MTAEESINRAQENKWKGTIRTKTSPRQTVDNYKKLQTKEMEKQAEAHESNRARAKEGGAQTNAKQSNRTRAKQKEKH